MKVALIGDVHGNLPALEAVLDDAAGRGSEAVWNVGDFVGYGASSDEVVRRLRDEGAVSIVGNYDRKVLRLPEKRRKWRRTKAPEKLRAFEQARSDMSPESLVYLESLPRELRMRLAGRRVLLTHGSPASEQESVTEATGEQRLAELAEMARADVVVFGHSHRPFSREVDGVLLVGTGSVGRPEGGDPRACYALMEIEPGQVSVAHYRIDYDAAAAAEDIRRRRLPEAFAEMVLRGESYVAVRSVAQPQGAEPAEGPAWREEVLAAARALAERCEHEAGHTHQVTKLALRLFDELQPLHELGEQERFWLHCGAVLHDIGWIDGQKGHHKTALRLILADESLPLDGRGRLIVASIARYHRKALPGKAHGHFSTLDKQDRRTVRLLGGILRVADGLDRTHADVVGEVSCPISPGGVVIRCVVDAPADAELWAAEKKADLLKQALGRPITFEATG